MLIVFMARDAESCSIGNQAGQARLAQSLKPIPKTKRPGDAGPWEWGSSFSGGIDASTAMSHFGLKFGFKGLDFAEAGKAGR